MTQKFCHESKNISCLTSKQEVVGSNPSVGRNFHFVILACFAFRAARLKQYKWNQPWCTPKPLIDWDFFAYSSETAEQNSSKLDRMQDLNVFYQAYVFRADRKKKTGWPPDLWLAGTF